MEGFKQEHKIGADRGDRAGNLGVEDQQHQSIGFDEGKTCQIDSKSPASAESP